MFRLILCSGFVLGLATGLTGCRIGSAPYDDCGPVSGGSMGVCGGSSCDTLYRSGSTLTGYRGGGYGEGSGVTAQAIPNNESWTMPEKVMPGNTTTPARTPARAPSRTTQKPTPVIQSLTKARVISTPPVPPPAAPYSPGTYSPGTLSPAPSPTPLTREGLMQQEQGIIDATIIDVQDNIAKPTTSSRTKPTRGIKQVSYEEIKW